jgi:hypothetical protein
VSFHGAPRWGFLDQCNPWSCLGLDFLNVSMPQCFNASIPQFLNVSLDILVMPSKVAIPSNI